HAFYRVAMFLGGKAWETAGSIWYRALSRKLRARPRFIDCARATVDAATELYGTGSEPEQAAVAGWAAVGVTVTAIPSERERRAVASRLAVIDVPHGAAEVPASYSGPRRA
ncbi:MAG TPA: M4 family metallopeptidase, partial [Thermoanaerobaculia bacterium]|nr:M4 family metallopeptidase [Thermoanaerobaculia bacterium]